MTVIVIRPATKADNPQITELHRKSALQNLSSSFIQTFLTEITIQLVVVVAAMLFILGGIPLTLCVLAIPLVAMVILLVVIAGWLHQLHTDLQDLHHLYQQHQKDHQACFLVAEAWESLGDDDHGVKFV